MTRPVSATATAKRQAAEEKRTLKAAGVKTTDSFQNFALKLGMNTDNPLSGSTYGFNPITRIRVLLEWIHRGSWVGGLAVDLPADDMTRAGIEITSAVDPDDAEKLQEAAIRFGVWEKLNEAIKWGRLYGGAIAVPLIEGQKFDTPLRLETIGKGAFKGVIVYDRWMVEPSMSDLVTEMGPSLGLPKYYRVTADGMALRFMTIHYSRAFRFGGIKTPYWQRVMDNLWDESVLERLYDRLVAFDSATTGVAQLIYKSYLRVFQIKGLRTLIAAGGDSLTKITQYVRLSAMYQGIEGATIIDGEDKFEGHQQNSFAGVAGALDSLAHQIAGALQIPMVRLLGESPAGMNSTGESDLRTYYDGIKQLQEKVLRAPLRNILVALAKSENIPLPDEFNFEFRPLWQLSDKEKADMGNTVSSAVIAAYDAGLISARRALSELKSGSRETGMFSTITDKEINEADPDPPSPDEAIVGEEGDEAALGGETKPGEPQPEVKEKAKAKAQDRASGADLGGMKIVIETPKGSARMGNGFLTPAMPADYGFIQGVAGADGDEIDCFVGPNLSSRDVWVVHQKNLATGAFDETKCMLGYDAEGDAIRDYCASFADRNGFNRILAMERMTLDQFRQWLASPKLKVA